MMQKYLLNLVVHFIFRFGGTTVTPESESTEYLVRNKNKRRKCGKRGKENMYKKEVREERGILNATPEEDNVDELVELDRPSAFFSALYTKINKIKIILKNLFLTSFHIHLPPPLPTHPLTLPPLPPLFTYFLSR